MFNTDTVRRTEVIHVRVTPSLLKAVRYLAKAANRSVSDWCSLRLADAVNNAETGGK